MTKKIRLSDLASSEEVLAHHLKNDGFREEWNRTALARAVAIGVIRYREERSLSQTQLAHLLGMKQPAVARIEAGEKNPTWETIARLSAVLGLEVQINIAPGKRRRLISKDLRKEANILETSEDGRILIALR